MKSEKVISCGHKEVHAMPQQTHKISINPVLHHDGNTRRVSLNKKKILIEKINFMAA